jgi:hypothetical protein
LSTKTSITRKAPKGRSGAVLSFIGSRRFFILLVAFFVLEALWIALSGIYPMAFDENFHLGIIRLYAHHAWPFWGGYSPGAGEFGAVARDPSYLYHWLMSFPYRLISAFTADQTIQVLVLRFMNIALFAAGLPLYRRLLLKTGASKAIVHLCLAFFVLIPVVPLLAAQINYDNLFIPLTALSLLLAIDFAGQLRTVRRIDARLLLWLVIAGLATSLVKYAFLPVFVVMAVYVLVNLWRVYPGKKLLPGLRRALGAIPRRTLWFLAGLLMVLMVLSAQRYAVNLARYHKPVPDCSDVLTVRQCSQYGPWRRDYAYAQDKDSQTSDSPLVFSADWMYGMWFRTFFAVDGPATIFQTRGPLPIPGIGALVFTSLSAAAAIACCRRLLKKYDRSVLLLFLAVMGFYVAVLWLDEYRSFLQTGRPVAINGRYLIALFPMLMIWCALGVNELLGRRYRLKLALAAAAMVCLLWGGGALTYILRSNDAWYWRSPAVRNANHAVQHAVGPLTPGYKHPTEFMGTHGT